ncbi:MAG: TetR/AcrR family transcriptional regulator [Spirochaetes bacterium]|nr:TetR/AcrR family transcriptional regulator [Spirochaetota bacterium]
MNTDTTMPEGWPYTKAKTTLVRAAALVMQERGPRAATLKNISQHAGVTEPAVFRHFDGVDGVFDGLCTAVEFFFDRINETYTAPGLKGLPRFEKAYFGILDILTEYADFAYLIVHASTIFLEYEELSDRIVALKQRDKIQVLACIKEASRAGQIRNDVDAETIAGAIVGNTLILLGSWLSSGGGFPLRERCAKSWKEMKKLIEKKKA